jgi:4-hydroxybenzoate polyprenyltransferase
MAYFAFYFLHALIKNSIGVLNVFLLRKGINFIIKNNIWIALAAISLYFTVILQLNIPMHLSLYAVFLFFATLFTYTLYQIPENKENYLKSKLISLLVYVFILLIILPNLSLSIINILIINVFLSILYKYPKFLFFNFKLPLRNYWFLKANIVALVWTFSSVIIAFILFKINPLEHMLLFIEKFVFILALSLPYDIKDIEQDKNELAMNSFVLQFGIKKTILVSQILLFLAFLLSTLYTHSIQLSTILIYFLAICTIENIPKLKSRNKFIFYIDGLIILYFIVVYFAYLWHNQI